MKRNAQTVGRTSLDKGNEAWRHSGESSLSKGASPVGDWECFLWTKDWVLSAIWSAFFGQWRGMCGNVCCAPRPNETEYAGCMSGTVGSVSQVELNRRVRSANRRKTLARKRNAVHVPTQRAAMVIAARCIKHRSAMRFLKQNAAPWLESRGRHTRRRWGSAATDPCCLVMAPEEDQRIPFPAHSQGSVLVSHGQAFAPMLFFFLLYWPLPSLSYSSGLRRLPRFLVSDSRIGIPSDGIRHFPP